MNSSSERLIRGNKSNIKKSNKHMKVQSVAFIVGVFLDVVHSNIESGPDIRLRGGSTAATAVPPSPPNVQNVPFQPSCNTDASGLRVPMGPPSSQTLKDSCPPPCARVVERLDKALERGDATGFEDVVQDLMHMKTAAKRAKELNVYSTPTGRWHAMQNLEKAAKSGDPAAVENAVKALKHADEAERKPGSGSWGEPLKY